MADPHIRDNADAAKARLGLPLVDLSKYLPEDRAVANAGVKWYSEDPEQARISRALVERASRPRDNYLIEGRFWDLSAFSGGKEVKFRGHDDAFYIDLFALGTKISAVRGIALSGDLKFDAKAERLRYRTGTPSRVLRNTTVIIAVRDPAIIKLVERIKP